MLKRIAPFSGRKEAPDVKRRPTSWHRPVLALFLMSAPGCRGTSGHGLAPDTGAAESAAEEAPDPPEPEDEFRVAQTIESKIFAYNSTKAQTDDRPWETASGTRCRWGKIPEPGSGIYIFLFSKLRAGAT